MTHQLTLNVIRLLLKLKKSFLLADVLKWHTLLMNTACSWLSWRLDGENSAYTPKGAHSYKQELPNNRFVNVVITVCSSTVRGSPRVEQAGPVEGVSERGFERRESFHNHKGHKRASSDVRRHGRADVIKCVLVCVCGLRACDSCTPFISTITSLSPPLSTLRLIKRRPLTPTGREWWGKEMWSKLGSSWWSLDRSNATWLELIALPVLQCWNGDRLKDEKSFKALIALLTCGDNEVDKCKESWNMQCHSKVWTRLPIHFWSIELECQKLWFTQFIISFSFEFRVKQLWKQETGCAKVWGNFLLFSYSSLSEILQSNPVNSLPS